MAGGPYMLKARIVHSENQLLTKPIYHKCVGIPRKLIPAEPPPRFAPHTLPPSSYPLHLTFHTPRAAPHSNIDHDRSHNRGLVTPPGQGVSIFRCRTRVMAGRVVLARSVL